MFSLQCHEYVVTFIHQWTLQTKRKNIVYDLLETISNNKLYVAISLYTRKNRSYKPEKEHILPTDTRHRTFAPFAPLPWTPPPPPPTWTPPTWTHQTSPTIPTRPPPPEPTPSPTWTHTPPPPTWTHHTSPPESTCALNPRNARV